MFLPRTLVDCVRSHSLALTIEPSVLAGLEVARLTADKAGHWVKSSGLAGVNSASRGCSNDDVGTTAVVDH